MTITIRPARPGEEGLVLGFIRALADYERLAHEVEADEAAIGAALLANLARRCVVEGLGRLEWWVLDWNEAAIGVYTSLGAQPMDQWTVFRLSGEALERLAEGSA
jgi:RimJ/RimL family protein N-acetyltransferase